MISLNYNVRGIVQSNESHIAIELKSCSMQYVVLVKRTQQRKQDLSVWASLSPGLANMLVYIFLNQ